MGRRHPACCAGRSQGGEMARIDAGLALFLPFVDRAGVSCKPLAVSLIGPSLPPEPAIVAGYWMAGRGFGATGIGPVSRSDLREARMRATGVLAFSKKVLANWSAKMSHSPHGECDVDSQGTDETTSSQQLAGRAHDAGPGCHADGFQQPAHQERAGGPTEEGNCRDCSRPPGAQSAQCDSRGLRRGPFGSHQALRSQPHSSQRVLDEREGIDIGRTTLSRTLVNAGVKSQQRRRLPKHRVRRQSMPREGMLTQVDASFHPWLGDQAPPLTSPNGVDDATRTVVHNAAAPGTGAPKWPAAAMTDDIRGLVEPTKITDGLTLQLLVAWRETPLFRHWRKC